MSTVDLQIWQFYAHDNDNNDRTDYFTKINYPLSMRTG